ncbi:unnamed protein product, partial [Durusdinium trenchii]
VVPVLKTTSHGGTLPAATHLLKSDPMDPSQIRHLVEVFYSRVWNARDDRALREILSPELRFRGSTEATERVGPEAFKAYRDAIHQALRDYTCTLQDVLVEGDCAFARVWFRGTHVGQLLGLPGTGRAVEWIGCARFRVVSGVHGARSIGRGSSIR